MSLTGDGHLKRVTSEMSQVSLEKKTQNRSAYIIPRKNKRRILIIPAYNYWVTNFEQIFNHC